MINLLLHAMVFFSSHLKLIFAFVVGFIGSAAYLTALYFKFIGDTETNRQIVLQPFFKKKKNFLEESQMGIQKCLWYCMFGGLIAVIFQFDVPNFVGVQSLILGATWPAIVSQFLSGRMANPTKSELDALDAKSQSYRTSPIIEQYLKALTKDDKK